MELLGFGVMIGIVLCVIFVGVGVLYAGTDKRKLDNDSDLRVYVPSRDRNRRGSERVDKRMEKVDNESLAADLRTIAFTGRLSAGERDLLKEAADRLDKTDIERLSEKLGVKLL